MTGKRKLLKNLEKEVKNQVKERRELADSEKITGKKLDPTNAPVIAAEEEMDREWKSEEEERELVEPKALTSEGMGIEPKEEKGEEAYPEIEKAIKKDADEDEDEDE